MGELDIAFMGLVEEVHTDFLELDIEPTPDEEPGGWLAGPHVAATVHLDGDWSGAVVMACTPGLARQIAMRMFTVEDAELTIEEVHDAMGEMANILGGGFKAMLNCEARLSLPSVASGANFDMGFPGGRVERLAIATCLGEPLYVSAVTRGGDVRVAASAAGE